MLVGVVMKLTGLTVGGSWLQMAFGRVHGGV
jgi:hypothetical protein